MRIGARLGTKVLLFGAVGLAACSSSHSGSAGHGGTGGTTGVAGTGGTTGVAGTGGTAGVAGSGGAAGYSGSGGTGGSSGSGGTTGVAGSAGTGGVACVGEPPVTEHNMCATIPSSKKGAADFTITSPDFTSCGAIPASMTCDGKAFATGSSPTLTWSGAPAGTMSFALLFKDIAILADNDPTKERLAYHWVMWDIPATRTGLPPGLTGGYHSTEVPGALQWASRNQYGFFPPCPNPFPREDARFTCGLVIDSYSFTLYALPVAKLTNLPAPDVDANGNPTGNYVVKMGHYIESLQALAVTEYRGTSKAWATSYAPSTPSQYPCSSIDGGTSAGPDGGTTDGGSASTCLQ